MFAVRYELNVCIVFRRNSVFKALKDLEDKLCKDMDWIYLA
jgi:hypothetical protein